MNDKPKASGSGPKAGLATAGVGVFAVVCCAGGPLILGAFGSLALGSVLGGVGVLAVVVVTALIVVWVRHRRACAAPRV